MWVKSRPYWNQKHQLLEFCGNQDFTLYSSRFINFNGYGWIREGMLGTAPQHPHLSQELQTCGGCCCLFRLFLQRSGEIAQRAMLEETTQKLTLALTFPIAADTGGQSPGEGFQIPWKAWSALALRSGDTWWGPCWAVCQSIALSWFILCVAWECFTCNFFGVELSIQEILALWEASIFAIKVRLILKTLGCRRLLR